MKDGAKSHGCISYDRLTRDRKKYGNDIIPDEAMSDLILHPSGTSVLLMSGLVRLHWDK